MAVVRRGEEWVANLNPNKGTEIGKVRPVLVLQADWATQLRLTTVMVCPLTTRLHRQAEPLRITLSARSRLLKDCQIMLEHTRAIERSRIGEGPLTTLTDEEIGEVERSLRAIFGLPG